MENIENQPINKPNIKPELDSQNQIRKDFNAVIKNSIQFLKELFDISHSTNQKETIERIKENIPMKGQTAWVLIFSILVASIGLNVSSTAVVIGAMLISPLMGPILGVGLSIGINDIETLKKSLINLGVMVSLSLLTSFLFFSIPIFQDVTPELKARTYPDIRDVLIALSGGLALIVALSRYKEMTHTIAGVAIATALMPPLCTAGFGLATGRIDYFGGAIFLFSINTVFIAIATFVVVKFLKFPLVKYLDPKKKKRIAQLTTFLVVLMLIPSSYMFYNLFRENQFKQNAKNFINYIENKGLSVISKDEKTINFQKREINLVVFGKPLLDDEIIELKKSMVDFGLKEVNLNVQQSNEGVEMKTQIDNLTKLYSKNQNIIFSREETIREKDDKIRLLENALTKFYSSQVALDKIGTEIKINYPDVSKITFTNQISSNFKKIDTIPIISVKWDAKTRNVNQQHKKLSQWLQARLEIKNLKIKKE